MNTNIVITLDTRRKTNDGLYPVIMRLGHNRTTTAIPIGVHVLQKDWDDKNRLVKKGYTGVGSVNRLNNIIQKKKAEAMDAILKLNESGELPMLTVKALKDKVFKKAEKHSFFVCADEIIEGLLEANRIGTARSYRDVVNALKHFNKGKDLLFQNITYGFLIKFETYHVGKGNSVNGLAVYMRTIRAIYNKAIKSGLIEKEHYPFDDYKLKTVPTEKRALDWDFLKRIIELEIKPGHECFKARHYFIASYMMYGMNFTDMAFLRKDNIEDGRITYRRKKTSKLYDIKITEQLDKIISHYMQLYPDSPYIFPIIKREGARLQYKDIECARKRYNTKLKVLAELCGIEKNLTSYVSRHSFATQAMLNQVPLNAISSMLGHSSLKTTEVYLKSLPSNILDDYNERTMSGT
jgi:integrase/recombinase XerD